MQFPSMSFSNSQPRVAARASSAASSATEVVAFCVAVSFGGIVGMEQRYGRDERTRRSYVGGDCIAFSDVCLEACWGSEDLGFESSAIG